jgi:hypothetical protein
MPKFGDPAQERLPARAADAVGASADAGSEQAEVTNPGGR